MRVLITGAGGFCGRYLRQFLAREEIEFRTVSTRQDSPADYRLPELSEQALRSVLSDCNPTHVIHLAGSSSGKSLYEFYEPNVLYAVHLLDALRETGFESVPVLLIGTAAEYGFIASEEALPITEELSPNPCTAYGISKLAQTRLGLFEASRGRNVVIARPFNLLGQGMPSHLVFPSFVRQIQEARETSGKCKIRVGNLSSARDFVPASVAVRFMWSLITEPRAYGQVVNICSGVPRTVQSLLDKLIELAGIPCEVEIDPSLFRENDTPVHYGCRRKLEDLVGELKVSDEAWEELFVQTLGR